MAGAIPSDRHGRKDGSVNLKRGLSVLAAGVMLFAVGPALVQDSQTTVACGLPPAGLLSDTVTYTLSADCEQGGTLEIAGGAIVTIDGGGHSIRAAADGGAVIRGLAGSTLNLKQVTVDGRDRARSSLVSTRGSLTAEQVTFTRSRGGPALSAETGAELTLSDVLFLANMSSGADFDGGGSALTVANGAAVTLDNAVFRDNLFGGAAVVVRRGASSLAASGCLTFSGNIPWNVTGSWTAEVSGSCRGSIGNNQPATTPRPEMLSCGIPGTGILDESASYRLRSDCASFGQWLLSDGVEISITGDGHSIRSGVPGVNVLTAANATLSLENLTLDGVRTVNFGQLNAIDLALRNAPSQALLNMGEASFTRALFEDNVNLEPRYSASVLFAWSEYRSSVTSFTDAIFRNNRGGDAALVNYRDGATISLNGCISFENNAPADMFWIVTDNSSGPCGLQFGPPYVTQDSAGDAAAQASAEGLEAFRLIEFPGQAGPAPVPAPTATATPAPTATPLPNACFFQNLGAIGRLCRVSGATVSTIDVYGIAADSTGTFLLRVTQTEVDNSERGTMVKSTADGRLAVFVEPDGNVTFAMGPNDEGKVHHVTLQDGLGGAVISTIDRFSGPPGAVSE